MRWGFALNPQELSAGQKLLHINWMLVLIVIAVGGIGVAMLYSAANGSWTPWAYSHAIRFAVLFVAMLVVALIDLRFWIRHAYLIYFIGLALLVLVEVMGATGMGARRWISVGLFVVQPSELMKICLVLALARYFHGTSLEEVARPAFLIVPLIMVAAPVYLVIRQPDLGTALMLIMCAGAIFFLAGVRMWKFATVLGLVIAAIPIGWNMLHSYQKKRIMTFLDPETDPLGSGYHILQSKIALGSGGLGGKDFLKGTQSHLSFLPEKHTDFIFTMYAEEFGLIGGLILVGLYSLILVYGIAISLRVRNQFGRILVMGVTVNFFLYMFINIAMVMGLIPVVGVPLPLISYGGTAMLTVMIGFGLMMSANLSRDVRVGRHGSADEF